MKQATPACIARTTFHAENARKTSGKIVDDIRVQ